MSDPRFTLPPAEVEGLPNELHRVLKEAKARGPMTREEMFEQKVSWVYGEMRLAGHDVTKDEVRQRLEANR